MSNWKWSYTTEHMKDINLQITEHMKSKAQNILQYRVEQELDICGPNKLNMMQCPYTFHTSLPFRHNLQFTYVQCKHPCSLKLCHSRSHGWWHKYDSIASYKHHRNRSLCWLQKTKQQSIRFVKLKTVNIQFFCLIWNSESTSTVVCYQRQEICWNYLNNLDKWNYCWLYWLW